MQGPDATKVEALLTAGMEFEGRVLMLHGPKVREASKLAYGSPRLDARMQLVAVAWRLMEIRSGVPGRTSAEIEERLALITAFYQGVPVIEILISEGQYIKTAAAIKQDYEIVVRLREVRANPDRDYGKTPQVRYAPENSKRIYGQLNDMAHITRHDLIREVLAKNERGEARGFDVFPRFVADTAIALYDVHLFTLFQVVREHFMLLSDMYGAAIVDELDLEIQIVLTSAERLEQDAGWDG
jgi:hypothetical protein